MFDSGIETLITRQNTEISGAAASFEKLHEILAEGDGARLCEEADDHEKPKGLGVNRAQQNQDPKESRTEIYKKLTMTVQQLQGNKMLRQTGFDEAKQGTPEKESAYRALVDAQDALLAAERRRAKHVSGALFVLEEKLDGFEKELMTAKAVRRDLVWLHLAGVKSLPLSMAPTTGEIASQAADRLRKLGPDWMLEGDADRIILRLSAAHKIWKSYCEQNDWVSRDFTGKMMARIVKHLQEHAPERLKNTHLNDVLATAEKYIDPPKSDGPKPPGPQ